MRLNLHFYLVSHMPCIQIILNHPSLENFTAFAYNVDEEIQSLVYNTIIHELHFNMLCNPNECHSKANRALSVDTLDSSY